MRGWLGFRAALFVFVRGSPRPAEGALKCGSLRDMRGRCATVAARAEWQLIALLVVAVLFGGGGSRYPLNNLVVELFAVGLLAINLRRIWVFIRSAHITLVSIAFISVLVPALQLVPLPSEVWTTLPGREIVEQSYELIGMQGRAFPFTLSFDRTALAFAAALSSLVALVLTWSLERSAVQKVVKAIVALGLLNWVIGAVQLSTRNTQLTWFSGGAPEQLHGTFAGHATASVFLAICMCFVACVKWEKGRSDLLRLGQLTAVTFLALSAVLTQSRGGIIVLVLMALFTALKFVRPTWQMINALPLKVTVMGAAAAATALAFMLTVGQNRLERTFSRFEDFKDERVIIWQDSVQTARRYWPTGAGTGTFDDVFQLDESLENIRPALAGRAHNDYLELVIELGLVGILIVSGWWITILIQSYRIRKCDDSWLRYTCVVALGGIALHSVVDFPLRNLIMLNMAAVFVGLLFRPLNGRDRSEGARSLRHRRERTHYTSS